MELIKKIKTTPKNMEMLFNLGSVINLRYYEIMNFEGILSDFQYENSTYVFKCVFRADEELAAEIKSARGFNGVWKLVKKYDPESIKKYVDEKIKKHEEEIKKLKELLNK